MFAALPTNSLKPSSRLVANAELERRRRERARLPFGDWLRLVTPSYSWDAPHLLHIQTHLAAMERREIDRLMLFLPPRHGKSEMTTVRYPVWRMQRDPSMNVIVGAYNKTLAESFSRRSRGIARQYLKLNDERQAADEWQTAQGGYFRAAGVGTGVTGKGACLPAGTMITTSVGDIPIQNLQHCLLSVKILAYDTDTGHLTYKAAQAFSVRQATGLYRITTTSGRVVEATGNHPFWTGRGYTEAAKLAAGDPLLRLVRQDVRARSVRDDQAYQPQLQRRVLFSGMFASASRGQESSPMQNMRQTSGQEVTRLLRGMSPAAARAQSRPPASRDNLPDVQRCIYGKVAGQGEVRRLLFSSMRRPRTLAGHVSDGQSEVEARSHTTARTAPLGQSVSSDACVGARARWSRVRCLQVNQAAACSPYRQLADEQRSIEPSNTLCQVSYATPRSDGFQAVADTVALVEYLHQPTAVYDIQVADRHNFFGNGVLVHNSLIVIDDPVKSREEANSAAYRERVWNWYKDDLYTRREPGAHMILIMCMTGDTPVLMADGTERPLREIKVGDKIATYDNGKLATSTVRNHRSNGLDSIFRIRTTCGKIVHANARHPFLVEEHGQLKWIRLKSLTTAHRIVTVKDNGASGKARHASLMDARNPLGRGATARHITAKKRGPMGIVHPRTIQSTDATCVSRLGTESPLPSMMPCSRRKTASAPFVDSRQGITCAHIGAANCALTTVTKPIRSEGFCVTTVTLPWDTPRQRLPHSPLPNISDFTTAQIESIDPAGVEEVFDIQIDHTENFIANGMVSHNTRWHEDDLAGRILESENAASWTVVNLPALAEDGDALGRQPGQALWLARFGEDDLENTRREMGTPSFTALYQQRPTALEGGMFKREYFDMVNVAPRNANRVRYWDKAGTVGDSGDYTAGVLMARDAAGTFYVEDVVRGRWSALERERIIRQTAEMDKATYTGLGGVAIWMEQEPGSGGKESAESTIRALAGHSVYAERVQGDKATRAEPFAAQCEARNVKLVAGPWNAAYLDEIAMFPNGRHDDQADASTGAFARLASGPRRRARSREY